MSMEITEWGVSPKGYVGLVMNGDHYQMPWMESLRLAEILLALGAGAAYLLQADLGAVKRVILESRLDAECLARDLVQRASE